MKPEQKKQSTQNYKNFGLTLMAILGLTFLIGLIGYFGFLNGNEELSAYEAGRLFGRSIGRSWRYFIDYFLLTGLGFGSLFAVLASLEKNKSFKWALIHAVLGWSYVIFYALTRKIIPTDQS